MVDPKKDAEKSVDEVFDAEPVELGADVPETGQADQSINDLIGEQNREAEEFAKSFLKTVLRLRGVRIDREQFLRSELHKRGIAREVIDEAIATSPKRCVERMLTSTPARTAFSFPATSTWRTSRCCAGRSPGRSTRWRRPATRCRPLRASACGGCPPVRCCTGPRSRPRSMLPQTSRAVDWPRPSSPTPTWTRSRFSDVGRHPTPAPRP